jgi:mono/diheme cytochrome c family protein
MKRSNRTGLALAAAAAIIAAGAPATADSPGAGGTRAPVPVTGEEVYRTVCQACHMADGRGAEGAGVIPSLAENPRLRATPYPIMVVAQGKGGMPWLSGTLSHAQIAEVVGYIRTHFGNDFQEPVTEADVARMAGASAAH